MNRLTHDLIGWTEGLRDLRIGGKRQIWIRPECLAEYSGALQLKTEATMNSPYVVIGTIFFGHVSPIPYTHVDSDVKLKHFGLAPNKTTR
jgi:hypothetical protein